MGIILIKGRERPIIRSNEIVRVVKDRWLGNKDEGVQKAQPSDQLDFGDEWSGTYGQIKSIEIEPVRSKPKPEDDYNAELTPTQQEANKARLARMRADLEAKGILKPKIKII